jgi:hypothetical protein
MTDRRSCRHVRRIGVTLVLAVLFSCAFAQTWREVPADMDPAMPSRATSGKVLIDESSLSAVAGDSTVKFRYRTTVPSIEDGSKSSTLEYEVSVDCSLMTEAVRAVRGIHQGFTTPVEVTKQMSRPTAVDPFSQSGRAAMIACETALPGSLNRFLSVPTAEECTTATTVPDFALCKADTVRLQIGVVQERVRSVATACGDQPVYAEMLERAVNLARGCLGRPACVRSALGRLEVAVRIDASRLAAGDTVRVNGDCDSARTLRRALAQERQRESAALELKAAESSLFSCAAKAWRRFDDGVSSAETVAKAAIASCRPDLNRLATAALDHEPVINDSAIRSRLTDELVSVVLESRAKKKVR